MVQDCCTIYGNSLHVYILIYTRYFIVLCSCSVYTWRFVSSTYTISMSVCVVAFCQLPINEYVMSCHVAWSLHDSCMSRVCHMGRGHIIIAWAYATSAWPVKGHRVAISAPCLVWEKFDCGALQRWKCFDDVKQLLYDLKMHQIFSRFL